MTELVDMGVPEIAAHGLDHVEVVGPIVRWVYYSLRWVHGQWERREAGVVSVPLTEIDGGIAFLRQRYGAKVHEAKHQPFSGGLGGLNGLVAN